MSLYRAGRSRGGLSRVNLSLPTAAFSYCSPHGHSPTLAGGVHWAWFKEEIDRALLDNHGRWPSLVPRIPGATSYARETSNQFASPRRGGRVPLKGTRVWFAPEHLLPGEVVG